MEFIEENDAHIGKRPVLLQPAQQNAFGHVADASAEAGLVVETNLVANFGPEGAPAFPGYPRGNRTRRHAPRLQHNNFLVPGQAGIEQHLRHLCGLA